MCPQIQRGGTSRNYRCRKIQNGRTRSISFSMNPRHLVVVVVVALLPTATPRLRQTAYEECMGSAPRTFSRDAKERLCAGVTPGNFPQSGSAVECAGAVAKARALSNDLAVELCAAGGNAAGRAGGECAAEAHRRLKHPIVPPALRMQLCLSAAPLTNPAAPVECAASAAKRLQHFTWLSSVANNGVSHRISLCRGAPPFAARAPVDCVAALPSKGGGGFLKNASASVQVALQLCARAMHAGPGFCAATAAKVLPLGLRPTSADQFVELCADAPSPHHGGDESTIATSSSAGGDTVATTRTSSSSMSTISSISALPTDFSLSTGPISCLRAAPHNWPFADRVKLCSGGARDDTPSKCVGAVKGQTK